MALRPGLEVYPSRTQLPGLLPQPVLAGVVGGVCFLGVAVLVSILAACLTCLTPALPPEKTG